MRTGLLSLLLAFGAVAPVVLAPAPVHADDDEPDDEFETTWIGARLGVWYRPEMAMSVQVAGSQGTALDGLIGTDLDIQRDLDIQENIFTDYALDFDSEALLELEIFIDLDLISVSLFLVPPFEYRGKTTITRTVEFGGVSFTGSEQIESSFEQMWFGGDVAINILNNGVVKLAPTIGLRGLAIDWELKGDTLGKADSSDIDSPFSVDDFEVFPYPEIGADVRVGLREWFEVTLKASGSWFNYYGMEGGTYRVEALATVWPIDYIGLEVGYRWLVYDFGSDSDDPEDAYDFDLDYHGVLIAIRARI
jgi:hypothetical protein